MSAIAGMVARRTIGDLNGGSAAPVQQPALSTDLTKPHLTCHNCQSQLGSVGNSPVVSVVAQRAMATLPEKATHQRTRTFNQKLVLRAIYDHNAISRAAVARLTGLTRTTVSQLVGELLRDGLVEEVGRGPSTGGKAPILLSVQALSRHLIGLDLGQSAFSGAVVDLRGNVLHSLRVPLEGRDGEQAVQVVIGLIDALLAANGEKPTLGIGIGAPGVIDSRRGTVRWAVNLDWADLPLGPLVERRYGLPVVVVNDSHAAAVAELTFGGHPRTSNLIVIRVGQGVGAGLILDGHLFQGDGSGAGEIGHASFGSGGLRCHCGRTGCLETIASMRAMVDAAHGQVPAVTDDQSLIAALIAGDEAVRAVVARAGGALGTAVGSMIGALNVSRVLLTGPAVALGDDWLAAVRQSAAAGALKLLADETRIGLGRAQDDDVLLGASALLMTHELGLSLAR